MKQLAILLLRLYPKAWRARYGEEIGALIEDGPGRWQMLPDLACGAIKEQFNMQSFKRFVGWLSAAGLLAAFLASFVITPRYTSRALSSLKGPGAENILEAAKSQLRSRAALVSIILDPRLNLYKEERARIPMEDVEDEMRLDLKIESPPAKTADSALAAIAFTYREPALAQTVVNKTISQLARGVALADHRNTVGNSETLTLLDPPSFPAHPIAPNRAAFTAAGFGAGFSAALLIALPRRREVCSSDTKQATQ